MVEGNRNSVSDEFCILWLTEIALDYNTRNYFYLLDEMQCCDQCFTAYLFIFLIISVAITAQINLFVDRVYFL